MKKIMLYAIVFISASMFMSSCKSVDVGAAEEAVIIKQPWLFGHGGVDDEPVTAGNEWLAWSTIYVKYDMSPQLHTEDFKNMMTKDHNTVDSSAYLKLQIKEKKSVKLHKGFREQWYKNNIQEVFRTMIRNKCSEHDMFDLASNRMILDTMQKEVFKELETYIKNLDMPVDIKDLQIGQVTPPDEVLKETHNTAAQKQSLLTQQARGVVEDARKLADAKKALADMAYMSGMGMTIEQYLEIRSLEIEKEKIEMVAAKQNVTVNFSSNSLHTNAKNVMPTYPQGQGK